MLTIVIGGAACGKSEYAEAYVQRLPGSKLYVATMQPIDEECRMRIAKHRAQRTHRGFDTLECYHNLADIKVMRGANVLLECMSNLVANELYSGNGQGSCEVLRGVKALLAQCGSLTIVTNEVFSGGTDYADDTLAFMRELAHINRILADQADFVVEVVCGLPNVLKGRSWQ